MTLHIMLPKLCLLIEAWTYNDLVASYHYTQTVEPCSFHMQCDPNGRTDNDARDKVLIGADITQIGEDPILAFDGF